MEIEDLEGSKETMGAIMNLFQVSVPLKIQNKKAALLTFLR